MCDLFFCSCSVCRKKQNRHFIVPSSHFKLVTGHTSMTTYTFGTHQAKHMFCTKCGVQSFYIPRSNPDGMGEWENMRRIFLNQKWLVWLLNYYLICVCYNLIIYSGNATLPGWTTSFENANRKVWWRELGGCHKKEQYSRKIQALI